MNKIEKDTHLPVTMLLFWPSTQNQMKLQDFIKTFIFKSFKFATNMNTFCSAVMYQDLKGQCKSVRTINRKITCHPDLGYSHLEEG